MPTRQPQGDQRTPIPERQISCVSTFMDGVLDRECDADREESGPNPDPNRGTRETGDVVGKRLQVDESPEAGERRYSGRIPR